MRELLPPATRANPLLIWCLSAFQTAGLVLILVILLYRFGDLGATLDDLNTAVGLGFYIALWATNWWATGKAVDGLDLANPDRSVRAALLGRGWLWGGLNGVLFLLVVFTPILIVIVARGETTILEMAVVLAYLLFLGSLVSFAAGSVIGLAFALIDLALLEIAHALARAAGVAAEPPVPAHAAGVEEDVPAG